MSGIEILGVLLGAFPLCIAAMEYYENIEKKTSVFHKYRRAHRRDQNQIRDCKLLVTLIVRKLLGSLLNEEIINQEEYDLLLASPGGPVWKSSHIDEALRDQLDECYESYLDSLNEINDLTQDLYEVCQVHNSRFQTLPVSQNSLLDPHAGNSQHERHFLKQANDRIACFAKRAQYALAATRREELLKKLWSCTKRLQTILHAKDAADEVLLGQPRTHALLSRPKTPRFWDHATDIHAILCKNWHCSRCRLSLELCLKHFEDGPARIDLSIPFCHGSKAVVVRQNTFEQPKQSHDSQERPDADDSLFRKRVKFTASDVSHRTTHAPQQYQWQQIEAAVPNFSRPRSRPVMNDHQRVLEMPMSDLANDGLCKVFSVVERGIKAGATATERGNEYQIYEADGRVPIAHRISLAEVMAINRPFRMSDAQRYKIAMTVVSSYVQFHGTPWSTGQWTSKGVLLSTDPDSNPMSSMELYISATVGTEDQYYQAMEGVSNFEALGIVLLEICFGFCLDDHQKWHHPEYRPWKHNPFARQMVAREWAEEVLENAGPDFAYVVNWMLRQAPVSLNDGKWRKEFISHVVEPLERLVGYLQPGNSRSSKIARVT